MDELRITARITGYPSPVARLGSPWLNAPPISDWVAWRGASVRVVISVADATGAPVDAAGVALRWTRGSTVADAPVSHIGLGTYETALHRVEDGPPWIGVATADDTPTKLPAVAVVRLSVAPLPLGATPPDDPSAVLLTWRPVELAGTVTGPWHMESAPVATDADPVAWLWGHNADGEAVRVLPGAGGGGTGPQGPRGPGWFVGVGVPAPGLGLDGDAYLRLDTGGVWIRAAGLWAYTGGSLLGPQGPKGDAGNQGIQGPKGDAGNQGIQGPKGDTGNQGIQGSKGDTGDQGIQGPKGDTGNQGIQGPKGDTGNQGIQGPKGDAGNQGIQGPKGDTGNQGIQGAKGDTGNQGIQGPKGDTGNQGVQGPAGVVWRGAYTTGTAYAVNDAVTYSGGLYYATSAITAAANTSWTAIAASIGTLVLGYIPRGPITGTTDTVVAGDAGTTIMYSSASAISVTVPDLGYGRSCDLIPIGDGQITVVAGSGVTLGSDKATPSYKSARKYAPISILGTGTGVAIVMGNTA